MDSTLTARKLQMTVQNVSQYVTAFNSSPGIGFSGVLNKEIAVT